MGRAGTITRIQPALTCGGVGRGRPTGILGRGVSQLRTRGLRPGRPGAFSVTGLGSTGVLSNTATQSFVIFMITFYGEIFVQNLLIHIFWIKGIPHNSKNKVQKSPARIQAWLFLTFKQITSTHQHSISIGQER